MRELSILVFDYRCFRAAALTSLALNACRAPSIGKLRGEVNMAKQKDRWSQREHGFDSAWVRAYFHLRRNPEGFSFSWIRK